MWAGTQLVRHVCQLCSFTAALLHRAQKIERPRGLGDQLFAIVLLLGPQEPAIKLCPNIAGQETSLKDVSQRTRVRRCDQSVHPLNPHAHHSSATTALAHLAKLSSAPAAQISSCMANHFVPPVYRSSATAVQRMACNLSACTSSAALAQLGRAAAHQPVLDQPASTIPILAQPVWHGLDEPLLISRFWTSPP
eukprot:366421-Chlamydomonas_euryale.AAC.5